MSVVDRVCELVDRTLSSEYEKCELEDGMIRMAVSAGVDSKDPDPMADRFAMAFGQTMKMRGATKYTAPVAEQNGDCVLLSLYSDGKE